MIGVLVRMRRREPRVLAGVAAGLTAAVLTVWVCAQAFATAAAEVDVVAAVFAVWTVGWLAGPLLGARTAPARVTPRCLAGTALLSWPAIASLVAFGGLVSFAAGRGVVAVLVAVPAAILQLVLVVLLCRVVATALGSAARSRGGRWLGVVVAVAVGTAAVGAAPALVAGRSAELSELVRMLPSGWAPVAVDAVAGGRWPVAVACLVGLAVLVVALHVGWADLVARRGVPRVPEPVIRKVV